MSISKTRLTSVTTRLSDIPPLTDAVGADVMWLREGYGMAAWGIAAEMDPGTGDARFARTSRWFDQTIAEAEIDDPCDLPGSGPVAFCSFTFDQDAPGSRVLIPRVVVGTSESGAWVTVNGGEDADLNALFSPHEALSAGEVEQHYDQPGEAFIASVRSVKERIVAAELSKVVLARTISVTAEHDFDIRAVISSLAATYPGCFTFRMGNLVGASPELLARRLGEWIDSIPLAGSERRGSTSDEDAALGAALLASTKDRWEHSLTVSSVSEKLAPVCDKLDVEQEPFLFLLPNVQHLGTKIQGHLAEPLSVLEAAGILHPTAAVCGVPQEDALKMIRICEPAGRGPYGGPVGWMDRHGDGEMAIALRCAWVDGSRATVWAGAGIVADSDPYAELAETELKARAMLSALSG